MWNLEVCLAGGSSQTLLVSANDIISNLKSRACLSFHLNPSTTELWDYFQHQKHRKLDPKHNSTLAEVGLLDGQSLLLVIKAPSIKPLQLPKALLQALKRQPGSQQQFSAQQLGNQHPNQPQLQPQQQQHQPYDSSKVEQTITNQQHYVNIHDKLLQALREYISCHLHLQDTDRSASSCLQQLCACDEQSDVHQQQDKAHDQQSSVQNLTHMLAAALSLHTDAPPQASKAVPLSSTHVCSSASSSAGGTCDDHGKYTAEMHDSSRWCCISSTGTTSETHTSSTCVVCMDSPRSVLLLPCKHLCLCDSCSKLLQQQGGSNSSTGSSSNIAQKPPQQQQQCPVCRSLVHQVIDGVVMV